MSRVSMLKASATSFVVRGTLESLQAYRTQFAFIPVRMAPRVNLAVLNFLYNIFAFAMLFPSIWIIPRLVGSLHPGAPGSDSGNPALDKNDMDSSMRMVFYPAVIGWTLLGVWIATLKIRISILSEKSIFEVKKKD